MSGNNSTLRKKVFVDKQFQTKFILNYVLLAVLGTAVFGGTAYFILNRQMGESLFSAHYSIKQTGEMVLPTILYLSLAFIAIFGSATILITLLVSHKISGPLFAISRYLKLMSEGNFNFEARLRTNDQTAVLADTLTDTVRAIGGRVNIVRESVENLKKDLSRLNALSGGKGNEHGEILKALSDVHEDLRIIEERLASFRTE